MASRPTADRGDWSSDLRRRSGEYLRSARHEAGLTQAQLASLVGLPYFTMISQLEQGRGYVPPDRYIEFANALGIDVKKFTMDQLRFQNPWAWAILFGTKRDIESLKDAPGRFSPPAKTR
jgi:transcriptional regulator with XRE-family HTH domain